MDRSIDFQFNGMEFLACHLRDYVTTCQSKSLRLWKNRRQLDGLHYIMQALIHQTELEGHREGQSQAQQLSQIEEQLAVLVAVFRHLLQVVQTPAHPGQLLKTGLKVIGKENMPSFW